MKYNSKMKKILSMISKNKKKMSLKIIKDKKVIEPRFKLVYGCLIIDNEGRLSEDNVNIQRLLEIYGDKLPFKNSASFCQAVPLFGQPVTS